MRKCYFLCMRGIELRQAEMLNDLPFTADEGPK